MEKFNEVVEHAKAIIAGAEAFEATPTKKVTASLRKSINELKKSATGAKLELLAHDKAGK